jgi:hypothetical protein
LKKISKQRLNIPICKVSDTRVALNSDYIKAQVEWLPKTNRSLEYVVEKLCKKHPDKLSYISGFSHERKSLYPTELAKLAKRFKEIRGANFRWYFTLKDIAYVDGLWRITTDDSKEQHYMDANSQLQIYKDGSWVRSVSALEYLAEYLQLDKIPETADYTVTNILSKVIPTGLVLSYRYGLEGMLTRLGIEYDFSETKKDLQGKSDRILIRLADGYLSFSRYPYAKSLIVGGLTAVDLSRFSFDDLNRRDIYYNVFEQSGIAPGFLRGIDSFFDLFVDATTHAILIDMGEPTTVGGLLVRATEMLVTTEHEQASSVTNFRFRSYDKIPALMYNEMAKAIAISKSNTLKGDAISVNPEAVYQRILQDALTTNIDVNNPVATIREKAVYTYAGPGGRTEESFTTRDRLYPEDGVGIISEGSVDSPSVGFRAYYSGDPSIKNMAGMEVPVDRKDLGSNNILSVVGSLIPGAVQDDSKRSLLTGAQVSQAVAISNYEPARVRTSYEQVVPYLCGEPFSYVAKYDGKVVGDDPKTKQLKIEYSNGERRVIPYGDTAHRYSAIGIYITQTVKPHPMLGKTFKKNDILAFSSDFFQEIPNTKRVVWKSGVNLIVALQDIEGTFEDSNIISRRAADLFTLKSIHDVQIIMTTSNHVVEFADIGDELIPTSPLLVYEDEETTMDTDHLDAETIELIERLNRAVPRAETSGTVMKIEVFYKAPLANMSKSMRKFISYVEKPLKDAAAFGKDTVNGAIEPHAITYSDKVGYIDLEEDTVIVKYYLQRQDKHNPASKQSIHSALKTVTSRIMQYPIYTEDRKWEIDMCYAQTGYLNRMVWSPVLAGMGSMMMRELNNQITSA